MPRSVDFEETQYGFRWGPVEVERSIEVDGHVFVRLKTTRFYFDIRVTPSGFIRTASFKRKKGE